MAKVLIVDDYKSIREVYTAFLTKKGHAVLAVNNGKQALETLALTPVDIVIMDYLMPEMNGLDCLREMKKRGDEIPVLFIKPVDQAGEKEARRLGIYRFIKKPHDLYELESLVIQATKM
jgi:DNA-binding NtrC family response regulator